MDGAVQVQLGLKKFFIYFLLSAVLGLFLNSLIQKYASSIWKEEAQSQLAEKNISGTPPTIVFSRYWWPVVGATISSATHRTSFNCYGLVTEVHDIFVPLPLYQLLTKQLRFGSVDVAQMKVTIQEDPACQEWSPNELGEAPAIVPAVQNDGGNVFSARMAHPKWFSLIEKWFSSKNEIMSKFPVPRMRVREITLDGSTLSGKSLIATGRAEFSFQDQLRFNVNFNPIEFKKKNRALSTNFNADLVADGEHVKLLADWAYDEGHLLLAMDYKKNSGIADVSLATKDLPVSVLNRWFDTPWAFQFLWFNCGLQLASSKENWNQSTWDISHCQVSGPHGEVKVQSKELQSIKNPQNIAFQIYNFDLDKVIKGKNQVPLDSVFKSFGVVEGRAQVNDNEFSSHLTLKNAQLIFSRRNQRKLQIIEEMKLEASYARSIYSVLINQAKIQNGVFDGFFAFDYNKHLKRSVGKMSVEKLQFSPEIQDLMWVGRFTPFMLSGDLNLDQNFRIDLARVNLSFQKYEAKGLTASNGTLLMEWKKDGGSLTASLAQLKATRGAGLPWLFAPFLDEGANRDILVFSRIYSQGHFEKTHLLVDKLIANVANYRLQLKGDITKRNSEGELAWGESSKSFSWKWIYADQRFTLIPLAAPMKEWLKLNDTYLEEYPFIRLENSGI